MIGQYITLFTGHSKFAVISLHSISSVVPSARHLFSGDFSSEEEAVEFVNQEFSDVHSIVEAQLERIEELETFARLNSLSLKNCSDQLTIQQQVNMALRNSILENTRRILKLEGKDTRLWIFIADIIYPR